MENLLSTLAIIMLGGALLFVIIALNNAHQQRMAALVTNWAATSGLRIVEWEQPWFRTGPFWVKSKSQTIYRVTVIDAQGRQRCAWLRCGQSFWTGDRVDVEWER